MFSLDSYVQEKRRIIDAELDKRLPQADTPPATLHEAMRYVVFSGGKRLRPIMCMAAAEAVQGDSNNVLLPAISLELIHTYSLVHDDLPALDDDDTRRGKPTCHVKFGEAQAILTGDALLTMAFEWVAETKSLPSDTLLQITRELAKASGNGGMVAGQVEDIRQARVTEEMLEFVQKHKTAALFKAAMRMGAIGGGATQTDLEKVTRYGEKFGLAFQILDDIGDIEEDKSLSAVTVYGLEESKKKAKDLGAEALAALDDLPGNTEPLKALISFILKPVV